MKKRLLMLVALASSFATAAYGQTPDWRKELDRQLPLLGHRNWIVVADSAYPWQTAPGIKTIYTGEKQLDVVRVALAAVDKARHVRGTVFVDAELPHVPEHSAKGIGEYRAGLSKVLEDRQVTRLPHGEIIELLDEAGETFHVLLLKTDLTLPYTSVFIRLDCGYWSDEAEQQLRAAIESQEGEGE
jgi:hypothetical protein